MFSKDKIKFRYRIRISDDADYPYLIQQKGWILWNTLAKEKTLFAAEASIESFVKLEIMRPGKVIKEYTHLDYLEDKLRGKNGKS